MEGEIYMKKYTQRRTYARRGYTYKGEYIYQVGTNT